MSSNAFQHIRAVRETPQYQNDQILGLLERTNSLLLDLQSLWVLFSPTNTASEVDESDILLTTGGSVVPSQATGDLSESTNDHDDRFLAMERFGPATTPTLPEETIQHPEITMDSRDALHLSQRINQWKLLREISIEDNEASWDLDENIVENLLQPNLLDTSILSENRSYYGDDMFEGYSKKEWAKFRKIANELKLSLSRKDEAPVSLPVALLMTLFRQKRQEEHHRGQQQYNRVLAANLARFKRYLTVLQLSNSQYNRKFLDNVLQNQLQFSRRGHLDEESFSSTASSSIVVCE